jgi:hypothetical protein
MITRAALSFVCLAISVAGVACMPNRSVVSSDADVDLAAELSAGYDASVRRDVATLRRATEPFHDLAAAQAAGYPMPMPACIADSTQGGMGRHYFDRKIYDDSLDIAHPEMLLYAPLPGGKQKLVAVEYVVPYRLRPPTSKPPRLFGQDLKRHDEFKYWYLHVWAWEKNSAGLFADWNPAIKCPVGRVIPSDARDLKAVKRGAFDRRYAGNVLKTDLNG